MKQSAGVVIIYQNKILLVHPTGSKRYWGNYSFPKGGIDDGESPLQAALREVEEEVGIRIKKNQLDPKMHTIPYVSKGKRSFGKAPKGEIYKMVYYWTCTIKSLSEIGLTDEVVPKGQLQREEVDWAGFVPANEVSRRVAPVMGIIIKHLNMGISEDFKLKTISEFVNEKYYNYEYFEKGKWGSPEEMKHDVEITLRNVLPREAFQIKSVTDQSSDKGIKFEIELSSGDTVHAYKNSQWRGEYEWYLNKKKMSKYDIQEEFFNKLTPLDKYLRELRGHDFFYNYADDHRAYKAGEKHVGVMKNLYNELSSGDKKKAYKEYLAQVKKLRDYKPAEFKNFNGI